MKKIIAFFVVLAILVTCLSGCENSLSSLIGGGESNSDEVGNFYLPSSMKVTVGDQSGKYDFEWTDNSCVIDLANGYELEFEHSDDNDTLLITLADNELSELKFDENGYIISADFIAENVNTDITYSDDYSEFVWDMYSEGVAECKVADNSITFDMPNTDSIVVGYNDQFLSYIKNVDQPESDENIYITSKVDSDGRLTDITYSLEGTEFAITVDTTDIKISSNWQKIPMTFLSVMLYPSGVSWTRDMIAMCYVR